MKEPTFECGVFVCGACGKTSPKRWQKTPTTSPGWDESCSMNAAYCRQRTAADVRVPEGCLYVAICEETGADLAFTGDGSRAVAGGGY